MTPLSARNARGVRGAAKKIMKKYEKSLDTADAVIHRTWPKIQFTDSVVLYVLEPIFLDFKVWDCDVPG